MPDIGMIELILIGLIGFLVLGPERLPEFLAQVGRVVRQGRAWMMHLKMQLDQEKESLSQPVQHIKDEINTSIKDTGIPNHTSSEKKES